MFFINILKNSLTLLFSSSDKKTKKRKSDLDVAAYFKNYKSLPLMEKTKKIRESRTKYYFKLRN